MVDDTGNQHLADEEHDCAEVNFILKLVSWHGHFCGTSPKRALI
jgi:hypothetical protein